jgi:hypothetical protein
MVTLGDITIFISYISSGFILAALIYFGWRVSQRRSDLSRSALRSSYFLIVAGVAHAFFAFFPDLLIPLLIIVVNATIYLELILLDRTKYGLIFTPFTTIVLGVSQYFRMMAPNSLPYYLTVTLALSVILIFSIVLFSQKQTYIFFSITAIIIVNLTLRIASGFILEWAFLFTIVVNVVTAGLYVGMYISVFRRTSFGIAASFLSMHVIISATAILVAFMIGRIDFAIYLFAELFVAVALILNAVYFLRDYSESSTLSSLLFSIAFLSMAGAFVLNIAVVTILNVLQILSIQTYFLELILFVTTMLAALLIAGAIVSVLGKEKILRMYSMSASSFLTYYTVEKASEFPQLVENVIMDLVVMMSLLFVVFIVIAYLSIRLLQMGAKETVWRFIAYFAGLTSLGIVVVLPFTASFILFAVLFSLSGLVFLLSSPIFTVYLKDKLSWK